MMYFQAGVILLQGVLLACLAGVFVQAYRGMSALSPGRRRLGNVLIAVSAAIFFASGLAKLAHFQPAVVEMGKLGFSGWKYQLAAGVELTSGVLVLIPRLRALAILFVSAHVGGAIVSHLIAGQYFAMLPSAVVLSTCWLGLFLRYPEALWSLSEARRPGPSEEGRARPSSTSEGERLAGMAGPL